MLVGLLTYMLVSLENECGTETGLFCSHLLARSLRSRNVFNFLAKLLKLNLAKNVVFLREQQLKQDLLEPNSRPAEWGHFRRVF